jgi:WD40 repeat protein
VLSADGRIFVGTRADRGGTQVWNLDSGKLLGELRDVNGNRLVASSITLSNRSDLLAAQSEQGGIYVYGLKPLNAVAQWESPRDSWIDCLKFAPSGTLLAASMKGNSHLVRLWEVPTGKEVATLPLETRRGLYDFAGEWARRVDFSPDGRLLAAGGSNGTVRVWDLTGRKVAPGKSPPSEPDPKEIMAFQAHADGVVVVQFSPTGRWLATADLESGRLKLWEVATGRFVTEARIGPSWIGATQLTAARLLFERSRVQWLTAETLLTERGRVWEVIPSVSQRFTFPNIRSTERRAFIFVTLCFSAREEWLACSSGTTADSLLINLRAPDSAPVPLKARPRKFAFSHDGGKLWGSDGRSNNVWQLPAATMDLFTLGDVQSIEGVFFNAQGERVAAVRKGAILKILNLDTGKELANLGKTGGGPFSPDGGYIASINSHEDNTKAFTKVFDLSTGTELIQALGPEGAGYDLDGHVALAHQARRLAIASGNRIGIYDPKSRKVVADLRGHSGDVWHLAFDESANLLASISADGTVKLWRVDTAEILATIHTGHEQRAWVALSPSARWLAVGDRSGQVRLWDLLEVRRQLADAGLDWPLVPGTAVPRK